MLPRTNHTFPGSLPLNVKIQVALFTGFGIDAIMAMERTVMVALQQELGCISVLRVLQLCLERLGYYMQVLKWPKHAVVSYSVRSVSA